MNESALVIIDMQNDFMPGGSLAVPFADQIIPHINQAMHFFNLIIASKDFHPKRHVSFASSHTDKKIGDTIKIEGNDQKLWPDHCIQGSTGAELDQRINKSLISYILLKGKDRHVDSYSVFFDNRKTSATGLHEYLASRGVKKIFVCGVAVEYCVKFSVIDAIDLGYETYVICDLCKPVEITPGDGKIALDDMKLHGAHIITLKELPLYLYRPVVVLKKNAL